MLGWSRTVAIGAMMHCAICIGAFFAQVFRIHIDVIHTIVLGLICAAVVRTYRGLLGIRQFR